MKTKIALTGTLLLFTSIFFGQHSFNKTDLEKENIKGAVKYIEHKYYEIEEKEDGLFDTIKSSVAIQYFNKHGYTIKNIYHDLPYDNTDLFVSEHTFDQQCVKKEDKEYRIWKGDTIYCKISNFSYKNKKLFSTEIQHCGVQIGYKPFKHYKEFWNEFGYHYKTIYFDSTGNVESQNFYAFEVDTIKNTCIYWPGKKGKESDRKIINSYNSIWQIIKSKSFYKNKLVSKNTTTYDTLGRIEKEVKYDHENKFRSGTWTWIHEYNENGDQIILNGKNDVEKLDYRYATFKYDEKGNWNKRYLFKNNKLYRIDERDIIHY